MLTGNAVVEPVWERYPLIASNSYARRWIQSCVMLGLARNTVAAYMYAVEGFLRFAQGHSLDLRRMSRETIVQYVGELRAQPRRANANVVRIDSGGCLSNATLQQRLTAVRLLFEFLVDEGLIRTNPVSRGHYTTSGHFGARGERGLIPKFRKLPWIPTEAQWTAYFGERDRRFRERDRFGKVGRCAASIVDFLASSGRVLVRARWVSEMVFSEIRPSV
ncbi:site-specific integrase [Burkholderia multivorans]|nr:site-specific integrase [Burkholderia multivorans]